MTAIAGFVDQQKTVWIGGDSAGVGGYSITVRSDAKVFRKGPMIFGFTTSFRMGQLLRYRLQIPIRRNEEDIEEYLATSFIDAVRDCLKGGGFASKNNEAETGGSFLIGYEGRLFQIDSDYQVGESRDGYDACGSGQDICIGALHALKFREEHGFEIIKTALSAAERHNANVSGPFVIASLPFTT